MSSSVAPNSIPARAPTGDICGELALRQRGLDALRAPGRARAVEHVGALGLVVDGRVGLAVEGGAEGLPPLGHAVDGQAQLDQGGYDWVGRPAAWLPRRAAPWPRSR